MRLIDADKLRMHYGLAEDCEKCTHDARDCQYNYYYTRMDFCVWLDEADVLEWKSVKKELPEMNRAVIVIDGEYMRIDALVTDFDTVPHWSEDGERPFDEIWMYVPELPEEKEEPIAE